MLRAKLPQFALSRLVRSLSENPVIFVSYFAQLKEEKFDFLLFLTFEF
jgi:hypothetical protein